mgnify:FL=1
MNRKKNIQCLHRESIILITASRIQRQGKNFCYVSIVGVRCIWKIRLGMNSHALQLLEASGRTPKVLYVDGSRKFLDHGVLVMEYLPGKALDYHTDLKYAAECLADIHSVR